MAGLTMAQDQFEAEFREELFQKYRQCPKYLMPKKVYSNTIEELKTAAQNTSSKSRHGYYILQKYEVLQCGDSEKLIKKRKSVDESPVYYVTIEDTYDIIKRAHITTGHGGRDKMKCNLGAKYANITKEALELFKSYCITCQKKRKQNKSAGVVVKPLLSSELNSRGQVDLVDMQSLPQAQFKWIMVYQCHLTKFVILRALASKRAAEVAFQLLDIFLLFGAPAILQSDSGSEFTAKVISELKELWPQLIMVHGKPRHPQSQGSVEQANGDIKDMLQAWMANNKTQDWSVGLRFVQHQKNSAHHSGIKRTPFKAMFGTDPRVGLASLRLPPEVLERLQSEEDLLTLFARPSEDEVLAQDPQPPPASAAPAATPQPKPAQDPQPSPLTKCQNMGREWMTSTAVIEDLSLETKLHDETVEFSAVKEEDTEDISGENYHRITEISDDTDEENAVYIMAEDVHTDMCPVSVETNFANVEGSESDSDDGDPLHVGPTVIDDSGDTDPSDSEEATPEVDHRKAKYKLLTSKQVKPYICKVCSKPFSLKGNLVQHMIVHTKEKTFSCDVCSKSFSWKSNLVSHMSVHTKKKPFNCDVCGRGFSDKRVLVRHMRVHTKEKPYVCDICNRAFSMKGTLVRHIRVHTKEKPFVCEVCKKSFTCRHHLVNHKALHNPDVRQFTPTPSVYPLMYPDQFFHILHNTPCYCFHNIGVPQMHIQVVGNSGGCILSSCPPGVPHGKPPGRVRPISSSSPQPRVMNCTAEVYKTLNVLTTMTLDSSSTQYPVCATVEKFSGSPTVYCRLTRSEPRLLQQVVSDMSQKDVSKNLSRYIEWLEQPGTTAQNAQPNAPAPQQDMRLSGHLQSELQLSVFSTPKERTSQLSVASAPSTVVVKSGRSSHHPDTCLRFSLGQSLQHEIRDVVTGIWQNDGSKCLTIYNVQMAVIMEDSGLGMEVPNNTIEFIAVKEENTEDKSEENSHRIKEVIDDIDEVNAIYIKTEYEVNTSPVQEEINNLREAVSISSDVLMCEEEDPLLLSEPFASKVCGDFCSPDQTFHKKGSDEETHKKLDAKEKRFICEICDKKFARRSKLLIHMRVHTREKPYSCDVCNKAFSQKHHLVEHVRIHTKEKPYTCEICSKPFCGRSNLVKHMRVHTKEKPFSCDMCNRAFSEKAALGRHVRIHTKEKPFNCVRCSKSFSEKGNLMKHMRVHA
ncbi:uncharacterized protein LOC125038654 [Penaeus chinensis]|uniref:uncharacterized protein LOC125038654 n=1 Tax=Penaeus chinensis TaxID=139456 RepID=UPI001FB6CD6C|nr:uncharacterized protein LOC125038654 [Penaeus chinensis]